MKNRKAVKEFAFQRLNINALRKNKILPPELQVCVGKDFSLIIEIHERVSREKLKTDEVPK